MKAARIIVALIFAFSCAGRAWGHPLVYEALRVNGPVLTRTPTSAKWLHVKEGMRLAEGQILQVADGGTITLEEQSATKAVGLSKDKIRITITKPIVTRLSGDLLRKIKLSAFFIDRAKAPLPADNKKEIPLTLRDAWDRLAAIVTSIPPAETPIGELSQLEREGMSFGVSAKKLELLAPTANSVVQSGEWPAEVKVLWKKPPNRSLSYLVYVWPANKPRGSAVAMTKQDFYTASLRQPGAYYVQVTSSDGAWQSIALPVHAIAPMDAIAASSNGSQKIPLSVTEALTASYPSDGLFTTESTGIVFSWALAVDWPNPAFEVRIYDGSGKMVRTLPTTADSVSTDLRAGTYKWNVSLVGTQFKSAENRFDVLDGGAMKTRTKRRQIVQQLISSGRDATLSFSDDL